MARETKHYALKKQAYLMELNAPRVIKRLSFEETRQAIHKVLTIDKFNDQIVDLLCFYFSGDERFNLEGYDLEKGICLFGGVGVGKTTLMKKFALNQIQSYSVRMCRAIEDDFSQDGDKTLRAYGISLPVAVNSDPFGAQFFGYCFDDLGTEPMSKYYGKDTNVMAEVILNRYDNDLPRNQTHITTNLTIDEIRVRYGTRVTDRMREMFNLIAFSPEAKSRRV